MSGVCGSEDASSRGDALIGEAVVDVVRGQEADAAVAVLAVVPVEEGAAVGAAVLPGAEAYVHFAGPSSFVMSQLHTWFGAVASNSGFLYAGCRS